MGMVDLASRSVGLHVVIELLGSIAFIVLSFNIPIFDSVMKCHSVKAWMNSAFADLRLGYNMSKHLLWYPIFNLGTHQSCLMVFPNDSTPL
ncbi:hypothetical protein RJT34_19862 [Clitoria ternatea]|uniref:Uncharacterized protein n=1 Tax=Clitoria ternatea TaxID=43366 RepID=A0AAN9IS95_CLITE